MRNATGNSSKPHAVTSTTGSINDGSGAVYGVMNNPSFSYDNNGNVVFETGTGGSRLR